MDKGMFVSLHFSITYTGSFHLNFDQNLILTQKLKSKPQMIDYFINIHFKLIFINQILFVLAKLIKFIDNSNINRELNDVSNFTTTIEKAEKWSW